MEEWVEFSKLEPFGDEWRQAGMIASWIYNMGRAGGKPTNPEDFMPLPVEEKEEAPQTVEQVAAIFAAAGATIEYANH